jgi:hypothetical protein
MLTTPPFMKFETLLFASEGIVKLFFNIFRPLKRFSNNAPEGRFLDFSVAGKHNGYDVNCREPIMGYMGYPQMKSQLCRIRKG